MHWGVENNQTYQDIALFENWLTRISRNQHAFICRCLIKATKICSFWLLIKKKQPIPEVQSTIKDTRSYSRKPPASQMCVRQITKQESKLWLQGLSSLWANFGSTVAPYSNSEHRWKQQVNPSKEEYCNSYTLYSQWTCWTHGFCTVTHDGSHLYHFMLQTVAMNY